jgi:alkanesulfonate monooxygenase SsuD/methylene tetrahydromethanopterin reductase-like flavin-dependent oxidoreductase (luciferase family)
MTPLAFEITPAGQPHLIKAPQDVARIARTAEEVGFSAVMVPEGGNDSLLACYAIAQATSTIRIGTSIAIIYNRQPTLCASAAVTVQEASAGRLILGLGVGHRPVLEAMGIEPAPNSRVRLREYVLTLKGILSGESKSIRVPQPSRPIPVQLGALTVETARLAGEIADGVQLFMCTPERLRILVKTVRDAAEGCGRNAADVAISFGMPAFIDDNPDRAYAQARRFLKLYTMLPFHRRQIIRNGFEREAEAARAAGERGDKAAQEAALTDKLIDTLAFVGPVSRCIDRIEEYREAGAQMLNIVPGSTETNDELRQTIKAFGKYCK